MSLKAYFIFERKSFLQKDILTFLKHLYDLPKNFQIIRQIVIFSPKIWQLLCQYFHQNSGKTLSKVY